MTLVRKAALYCDGCGISAALDPDEAKGVTRGSKLAWPAEVRAWRALDGGRHLCPECADVYAEKEAEKRRELDALVSARLPELEI